jgi:hypothetical protein
MEQCYDLETHFISETLRYKLAIITYDTTISVDDNFLRGRGEFCDALLDILCHNPPKTAALP